MAVQGIATSSYLQPLVGVSTGGTGYAPAAAPSAVASTSTQDRVSFSEEAKQKAKEEQDSQSDAKKLSEEEKKELEKMKSREQEVISHEQAHKAAGGQYASAPQYSYSRGPDGASYVSDGEVAIDISPGSDPQSTIQKANQVRAAALAPANPSPQDMRVAAEATQMALEAQRNLAEEQRKELKEKTTQEEPKEDQGSKPMLPATVTDEAEAVEEGKEEPKAGQNTSPTPANDVVQRNPYALVAQPDNTTAGDNAPPTYRRSISLTA